MVPPDATLGRVLKLLFRELGGDDPSRVAVVVDEYDAFINDAIQAVVDGDAEPKAIRTVLQVLSEFYAVVKSMRQYCTIITGVTAFAKASLFSGANDVLDVSYDPANEFLCGFTWAEVLGA